MLVGVARKTHQVRNMLVMVRFYCARDERCSVLCGFTQNYVLHYGFMKNWDFQNYLCSIDKHMATLFKMDQKSICLSPLTTCSYCFWNEDAWRAVELEGLRLCIAKPNYNTGGPLSRYKDITWQTDLHAVTTSKKTWPVTRLGEPRRPS